MQVPSKIGNVRIRTMADGSFMISRRDKDVEAYLDEHYMRLKNQLLWVPRPVKQANMPMLIPVFDGKPCNIVGKGPSLDRIKEATFTPGPIICINESIHAVEPLQLPNPLFLIQQDAGLRDTCRPKLATTGCLIAKMSQHYYANVPNVYVFEPRSYVGTNSELTVCCTIEIAKALGASSFQFLAFDACVNKNTRYAEAIGYPSTLGGLPARFLNHRARIEAHLTGYEATWWVATPQEIKPLEQSAL